MPFFSNLGTKSKKDTKSRSASRKRGSIFGSLLNKKEEREENKEVAKEEKTEETAVTKEETKVEPAATEDKTLASEAPVASGTCDLVATSN